MESIPSYGTDSTLDIVTWNIEHFPKNGQASIQYVYEIISALDVDIIAFQEVDDSASFRQMMEYLPNYQFFYQPQYYAGAAYIYKPSVVQVNSVYEIMNTSQYWSAFPRAPLVMDFNYQNQRYYIMNNHLKCCGNGIIDYSNSDDEETRRYYACNNLRSYIDNYLATQNVIVLGDLNDEITDEMINNVFKSFINYPESYLFADMEIAQSSSTGWSYPSYPSHLDHILITNELFDDFQNLGSGISTQKIDYYLNNGWSEYYQNVSDHRPVAMKLRINANSGVDFITAAENFSAFPNPVTSTVMFSFDGTTIDSQIEIYNSTGQMVDVIKISNNQNSIPWSRGDLKQGLYYAILKNEKASFVSRIILL